VVDLESYVNAFRQPSNIIYGIGEGRPIWKTIPLRLGVTVVSVFVLVVGAAFLRGEGKSTSGVSFF
jgi:membrane protein